MEDDPLAFFANEAPAAAKKTVVKEEPVVVAAHQGEVLRKVDTAKYATKGGSKSTVKKEATPEAIAAKAAISTSGSRGLGFGVAVPGQQKIDHSKVLDVLDIVDKDYGSSSALDDTIFGNTSPSNKTQSNNTDIDDLFVSSNSKKDKTIRSGTMRVADNVADDHRLDDLKTTSGFMEKEDDSTLDYDTFGKYHMPLYVPLIFHCTQH